VDCCEALTEGSETAKVGTDEQEVHMRLLDWISRHITAKS